MKKLNPILYSLTTGIGDSHGVWETLPSRTGEHTWLVRSWVIFSTKTKEVILRLQKFFFWLKAIISSRVFFFLRFCFSIWTIFKVNTLKWWMNFLQYLLQYSFCFCVLVFWWWGIWDLSSPTRDQTLTPCIGRWSLNLWTSTETPQVV